MIPDWIQDLSRLGGSRVSDGLERGAESYLRTLGAAESRPLTGSCTERIRPE